MEITVNWVQCRSALYAHARQLGATQTLCGIEWHSEPVILEPTAVRHECDECLSRLKRLETPEGRFVYAAVHTLDVPPECWALAAYVTKLNSELAIQIEEVRTRIDALYTRPQAG